MSEKYIVNGREFRTVIDYKRALKDKEKLDPYEKKLEKAGYQECKRLRESLIGQKYSFQTALYDDFLNKIEKKIVIFESERSKKVDQMARDELKKREKRKNYLSLICVILATVCFICFGVYYYFDNRTNENHKKLEEMKEQAKKDAILKEIEDNDSTVDNYVLNRDTENTELPILDEYKTLVSANKKLIGWVKIADTNIDYPVMQTTNNDFYQDHNINQEYDKNGSIFMDKDCNVTKPSTNFILYGHHMKSGNMFGTLDKYDSYDYYKEHSYIEFDTIYEKGKYEVMYVFRSKVFNEDEVTFKYYQFIDAFSDKEFDSYMDEMRSISLYDTGVTASFGDRLLTLSTCDYQEKNGRFVVVAKRIR